MKQSFNVQFYCRSAKKTKNGTAPLELCININGTRKFINLPYKVKPEDYQRKRQPKELVDYMGLMRTRINEILTEMLRQGEAVTTEALIGYIRNGGYRSYTVEDLFDEYLGIQAARIGSGITKGVYRKYELVKELFFEDVDCSKECSVALTHANILKFKVKCDSRYESATAAGYMQKLKSYVLFALDNGKIQVNPFQGIKIIRGNKPIVYLTESEQKVFKNTTIENESLRKVRDFALLQLNTGMAYVDCENITKEDVKCSGGIYYIEKPRQKTGKMFTSVIVHPEEFIGILDRYEGKAPKISNQKLNSYLKAIADLCGIKTHLTTHTFRRSYATSLLNAGVRIETVAAAMGHSEKICKRYYAEMERNTVLSEIAAKIG